MGKTLALLNPNSLLGKEIGIGLGRIQEVWSDVRLLSEDPEAAGLLSEAGGQAGLVQELSDDSLAGVDLLIRCPDEDRVADPSTLPPAGVPTVLDVGLADLPPGAEPLVSGVNLDSTEYPTHLVSPHPTVVALSLLLHGLAEVGIEQSVSHILLPASLQATRGLDELLEQTRSILTFSGEMPDEVFSHQLAFNAIPAAFASG